MKGLLIAIEGIDGSGKSSQANLLNHWLKSFSDSFLTQWNSSDWVHVINKKAKKKNKLSPLTFSLINATDFADRYERYILTMVKSGFNVVSDRYIYTAYARDSIRGIDLKWVKKLYSFAINPDIIFYIKIKPEDAILRLKNRKIKPYEAGLDVFPDLNEEEGYIKYQTLVSNFYDKIAKENNFIVINGNNSIKDIQLYMRKKISDIL